MLAARQSQCRHRAHSPAMDSNDSTRGSPPSAAGGLGATLASSAISVSLSLPITEENALVGASTPAPARKRSTEAAARFPDAMARAGSSVGRTASPAANTPAGGVAPPDARRSDDDRVERLDERVEVRRSDAAADLRTQTLDDAQLGVEHVGRQQRLVEGVP